MSKVWLSHSSRGKRCPSKPLRLARQKTFCVSHVTIREGLVYLFMISRIGRDLLRKHRNVYFLGCLEKEPRRARRDLVDMLIHLAWHRARKVEYR